MSGIIFYNGEISHLLTSNNFDQNKQNGAEAIFIGRVRNDTLEDKMVESIEFTAQEEIAQEQSELIIKKAIDKFMVSEVSISHSLGTVKAGQICFIVRTKSHHRKEAFEALPWLVNEIKRRCPIFGKEIFEDGTYVWKKNKTDF